MRITSKPANGHETKQTLLYPARGGPGKSLFHAGWWPANADSTWRMRLRRAAAQPPSSNRNGAGGVSRPAPQLSLRATLPSTTSGPIPSSGPRKPPTSSPKCCAGVPRSMLFNLLEALHSRMIVTWVLRIDRVFSARADSFATQSKGTPRLAGEAIGVFACGSRSAKTPTEHRSSSWQSEAKSLIEATHRLHVLKWPARTRDPFQKGERGPTHRRMELHGASVPGGSCPSTDQANFGPERAPQLL